MNKRLLTSLVVLTGIFLLLASIVWANPPAPVVKTGQTTSYRTGDDGDYEKGLSNPNPRFMDNEDGTVTDNLSGLMWAKAANENGTMLWNDAIDYVNGLSLGSDSCGSSYTDWRLPNIKELQSLIDFKNYDPSLPSDHPFLNLERYYWSSTSHSFNSDSFAWRISMQDGGVIGSTKVNDHYVWPVRAGD
jgi:hypothetical protein